MDVIPTITSVIRKKGDGYYDQTDDDFNSAQDERSTLNDEHRSHKNYIENTTEFHYGQNNYLGPGTRIVQRIEKGVRPISLYDAAAMIHDIEYTSLDQRTADTNMLNNIKRASLLGSYDPYTALIKLSFAIKDKVGYNSIKDDNLYQHLKQQVTQQQLLADYPMMSFSTGSIPTSEKISLSTSLLP